MRGRSLDGNPPHDSAPAKSSAPITTMWSAGARSNLTNRGLYQMGDVQARSWITGCTNGKVVWLLQQEAPRSAFACRSGSLELDMRSRSLRH